MSKQNNMRNKIVAGNWKMNLGMSDSIELVQKIIFDKHKDSQRVIIAPPLTNLYRLGQLLDLNNSKIELAAQNFYFPKAGPFTGEVSAEMLLEIGVNIVIIGHSERRTYFFEDDQVLFRKAQSALAHGLEIIYCIGETLAERKAETHLNKVKSQLDDLMVKIDKKHWASNSIILAYEPVWAIGTGVTASKQQAQEMHYFIRKLLKETIGSKISQNISILYGGSIKSSNALEIFEQPDIDGGLVGGASLDASSFNSIIESARKTDKR